ncbi:hypothetical protein A2643_01630 [Candidatus Nomurabacteria bacterium RIFCSPHIGHO2_01_FULL_39_220]|uniref:Uncharacterized protein n=1 Tax=Candidatus Nomurabacteria bacterium RIFCSPLOWO2_02_FULL_40_67 TaxID=1801787 RepID=A0A1F6Y5E0_9BACT|nr:MAG: hypothetical protein UU01_C0011G0023 [Parcubacteria group bacterium GW2011_GWA2_40_37]KKS73063.1 MAG: hypothetical protein UV43_C0010G0021 [Parcubacteria group bacterium GW2011_GWF2_42_7]OGI61691.1 MAG: hypothetical protein A2W12_02365 [Candidatus Nomurabacteria bacterium RBG_16_40_11]OGI69954.1 MAG: hypothetical protein A2643_01630 [Candidatus Nomurabacteria bacterium RIFCSPHIGHO2_01_FULL_39_220]OGI73425.1 MAG: hypothetical protein A2W56_01030 [Candidatus Nomurabacteria bacterium RIFCS
MPKTKTKKGSAKRRVGILRGGTGEHYASSLKKGGDIILYISENLSNKYKVVDILIDKDHIWHLGGLPISPSDLAHRVDIVWNTTHPSFSNILDSLSIPNIGISSFFHILENNKDTLRKHIKDLEISLPRQVVSSKSARVVFEKFGSPWVVKSFSDGSNSLAVHLAHTFNELVARIEDGLKQGKSILVEEFIVGKVASVHSVPYFRGQEFYVFPPINVFGQLSFGEKEKLISLAKGLHKHIGAKHYLKSNFVLNKRGKIYLLDLDSTPNLNSYSHFSQACESVGAKTHHVVEHVLDSALGAI